MSLRNKIRCRNITLPQLTLKLMAGAAQKWIKKNQASVIAMN